jgi:hypothetical protein
VITMRHAAHRLSWRRSEGFRLDWFGGRRRCRALTVPVKGTLDFHNMSRHVRCEKFTSDHREARIRLTR